MMFLYPNTIVNGQVTSMADHTITTYHLNWPCYYPQPWSSDLPAATAHVSESTEKNTDLDAWQVQTLGIIVVFWALIT
jgi:hypothetical protein